MKYATYRRIDKETGEITTTSDVHVLRSLKSTYVDSIIPDIAEQLDDGEMVNTPYALYVNAAGNPVDERATAFLDKHKAWLRGEAVFYETP